MNDRLVRRKYCKALLSKMAVLRSNGKFCDIDVKVGGKVFKCHRLVLSAASDYFNVMFKGDFKEGSMMEVALQDIAANVFEGILQFMYTGELVIHTSNVYEMIRAAEFYKLPSLLELCVLFVEKNLNNVAEDILKIFSLSHTLEMKPLIKLLAKHICNNFGYFSTTPDFLKLTFDSLMEVLNLVDGKQHGDVFLEGIYTWITHQVNLTAAERKSYSDRLFKKIDFTKLTVEYTRRRTERFMKELTGASTSIDGATPTATLPTNAFQESTRLLHVYVSGISSSRPTSTGVFTVNSNLIEPHFTWTYCGKVEFRADFMRNIALDDKLYSLRFSKNRSNVSSPKQTFRSGSTISISPYTSLKPPPCMLDEFDMCGLANEIYVYHKNSPSASSRGEFARGLYFYKRDIDSWFTLPRPESISYKACMTCDEKRVYLIGAQHRDSNGSVVEAYDPRTRGWSVISRTSNEDVNELTCCAFGKKIYLASRRYHSLSFKMYDLISGAWRNLETLDHSWGTEKQRLVHWQVPSLKEDSDFLCSFNQTLSFDSKIISFVKPSICYDYWQTLTFDGVEKKKIFPVTDIYNCKFHILDMVTF